MTTKEPGRICFVCKVRQLYSSFHLQEKVCDACRRKRRTRSFRRSCVACGASFVSSSQRASACSEPCRRARKLDAQRSRRARAQIELKAQ